MIITILSTVLIFGGLITIFFFVAKVNSDISSYHTLLSLAENKCPICGAEIYYRISSGNGIMISKECKSPAEYICSYCPDCKYQPKIGPFEAKQMTEWDKGET